MTAGATNTPYKSTAFNATLILTISLSVIALDSLIPAIPLMIEAFHAEPRMGQFSIGLYLAGYALGQIPVGLAADRYGRQPIFLAGMLLFTLMSLLTVLAPSIEVLLVARFVQGLAGTVGPVLARAVARDTHEGAALAHIMAVLVGALAIWAMSAPMLGTVLVMAFGWKAPLWLNVIVGMVSIVMLLLYVPETHAPQKDQHLLRQGLDSLLLFLRTPPSVWGTLLVGFTYFGYFSIATGLASILVDYYGFRPEMVGWGFAVAVSFYMASAQSARILVKRIDKLRLIGWGARCYAFSLLVNGLCLALLWQGSQLPLALAAVGVMSYASGMGLIFANATAITLEPVPRIAGFAASLLGTVQMGLGTVGAALTALFYHHSPSSLLAVLATGASGALLLMVWQKRRRIV